jgi:hypothetical protein
MHLINSKNQLKMKIGAFWDIVPPCSLGVDRCFIALIMEAVHSETSVYYETA